jgi:CRISPR-associated protein Csx10
VVLAAGSTVRLKLNTPLTAEEREQLKEVEAHGIGLRREEGYGRVAFNHPVYDNCAGLADTKVEIPQAMGLVEETEERTTVKFQKWEETLDEPKWSAYKSAPFEALARWLDAHRHEEISWLLDEIDRLGQPGETLIEHIGGSKEYGARDKKNRLTEDGLAPIKRLLRELEDHDAARRALGVHMIANRLAGVAGGKEEGR